MTPTSSNDAWPSGGPLLALSANDGWGILNFRRGLIAALQADGFRVVVLAPDGPYSQAIRALGADFVPIPIEPRGRSVAADLRALAGYHRQLRALRPAAFLGFTIKPNIYGSMAAHMLGIPVINNVTGLGATFERKGFLNRVVAGLYRLSFRRSAKVFFQNPDDRALFLERGLVRPDQTGLLPGSGVDLDHFSPRPKTKEGKITFLLAARLLWAKGIGEFVEAARTVGAAREDVRFRLLGALEPNGPGAVGEAELQAWVEEGLIDYRGVTSDVRAELAQADCVVLPSYYREGTPRILLEASAMAIPIITADSVGCREAVIPGVSGLLCQPKSPQSLADALFRVASMKEEQRQSMGRAGRAFMERYFAETVVHRSYRDALAEALSKGL